METVQVEHFYLGCLAHASYLVGSEGVATVIDPQRDVDIYLEAAAQKGLKIEHIIETHLHADFVSGHRELAERTGARIYLGEGSGATFPHTAVKEGDSVRFGRCLFEFLQTPGHTIESISIRMTDLGARSGLRPSSQATLSSSVMSDGPICQRNTLRSSLLRSCTGVCTRSSSLFQMTRRFSLRTGPAPCAAARWVRSALRRSDRNAGLTTRCRPARATNSSTY